jgi:dTDP-4-amino-4,6-dideoxygalactose transaminase
MYRSHGVTKDAARFANPKREIRGPWYYEQHCLGFNYRITDFQSALGINQMRKLGRFIKMRRLIAGIYNKELKAIKSIDLPVEKSYVKSAWHLYPIRLSFRKDIETKRKGLFNRLRKKGIGVQVHYIPVHMQPYYRKNLGYSPGDYPNAEDYYRRTLSIPLYPTMARREVYYVIEKLKEILR